MFYTSDIKFLKIAIENQNIWRRFVEQINLVKFTLCILHRHRIHRIISLEKKIVFLIFGNVY